MTPLVSIIIPCYNSSKNLPETLDSILSQAYPHFECLIIDDGSTDETKIIAQNYTRQDSRFHYYFQNNAGAATARNKGINYSTGEFIQFVDSDDLLPPEKLKIHVDYLLQNESVDIVYGEYVFFNKSEDLNSSYALSNKNNFTKKIDSKTENILKYFVNDNIMGPLAPILRRKVIESVSFDINLKNCEDYDFWFQAAILGFRFCYLENTKTIYYYRKHPDNKSANSTRMDYARSLIKQKYMSTIKKRNPELFPVLYNGFLLNHKRYLFEKEKKNSADILYTLKLSYKHNSIRLLWITLEYILIPNRIWKLVHRNGGLIKYLRIKVQDNFL